MLTDRENNNYGTPLHLAVDSGEREIIELCLNHSELKTFFIFKVGFYFVCLQIFFPENHKIQHMCKVGRVIYNMYGK